MSVQPAKAQFEALLDFLKRTRGFDFSGYKRSTLMRRIGRRLQATGVDSFEDYMDYLEVHPDEFTELFDTILINVTGFFRDPEAWQFLATQVLPGIAQGERSNEGVRVWCAGCSTGEEAYTTAMVLAEAMGDEQFRERVKVYATDVDEAALNDARVASYTNKQLESVPADLRKKYFEPFNGRLVFRKHLRRSIIFGRHDLLRDAPISRINLLVCRNVLMYFNAEAQARILAHFHFARKETGYLFLGKAEMLLTHPELFTPLDLKRRVFTKATATRARDRTLLFGQAFAAENSGERPAAGTLLESVFELGREPQLVAAPNETLLLANEQARTVFGLAARDFGRPLRELSVGYRPVELVPLLDQAVATRRPGHARSIEWRSNDGASRYFDLNVLPLRTRSCSRASEELETTNEELQSTNEELETMNEELQSTNQELQTINDDLCERTDESTRLNAFLEAIVDGLDDGLMVLDRELSVRLWNRCAEDLWGLRRDEVRGKHLFSLDLGLPVDRLRQPLAACMSGEASRQEVSVEAVNRRGKTVQPQGTL